MEAVASTLEYLEAAVENKVLCARLSDPAEECHLSSQFLDTIRHEWDSCLKRTYSPMALV